MKYTRILLKLSGESLLGRSSSGIDPVQLNAFAKQVKDAWDLEDARFYFLLGDCQVRNPESRWQRMPEQNYLKAIQLDPWNAEYRLTLGRFYRKRGLKLRARKQFEEVLQIAPAHEGAAKELDTLD